MLYKWHLYKIVVDAIMQYTSNLIFFIVWDQLICSNCFVIDDLLQFVQVSVLIV